MSKAKSKKKKDEVQEIPKYYPDHLVDALNVQIKEDDKDINNLMGQLTKKKMDYYDQEKKYKKEEKAMSEVLDNNTKINTILNEEIKQIREERELFENDCKINFDKKFEEVQEEKKIAIKKLTEEMKGVKVYLELMDNEKKELTEKVERLELEIQRLNNENSDTIQKYENQIREINEKHSDKLKQTVDIFEKFLENNKELLTTDLYTDYRNLKSKYDSKKNESNDYKKKNNLLYEQNRMFKYSMKNNNDIIDECARAQVEAKKKNKKLKEQIAQKDKIIEQMKLDYQTQITKMNDNFSQILQKNENEIASLRNELTNKTKRLNSILNTSNNAMNSRSYLELFFLEQLKECKLEVARKKKIEEERKKSIFPFLNLSVSTQLNNNSASTEDDSFFLTSAKKVGVRDIDPEYKEKLLINLLNAFHEQKNS